MIVYFLYAPPYNLVVNFFLNEIGFFCHGTLDYRAECLPLYNWKLPEQSRSKFDEEIMRDTLKMMTAATGNGHPFPTGEQNHLFFDYFASIVRNRVKFDFVLSHTSFDS